MADEIFNRDEARLLKTRDGANLNFRKFELKFEFEFELLRPRFSTRKNKNPKEEAQEEIHT